jgi:hypothetical protein
MTDSTPPIGITPEMLRKWRTPIRGALNPQLMTNPVWKWLIESRLHAHQANALFSGDSMTSEAPGWCFDRFGQSCTPLPDGRTVWIAGEHADYYHPDFFIYNDVVVKSPQGAIEIYGYPPDIFPPTDFHSASLVNGRLIIIGNLGYGGQRRQGVTQVLALELNSWQILRLSTEGAGPGWIHGHSARLEDDAGGRPLPARNPA